MRGCNWTFPVLNYLVQVERDYLSPTTIQRCAREVFLRNAADYAVDPKKAWVRARGTLQHSALEKYPEGLTEVRLQRTIVLNGVTYVIRGTADNIIPRQGMIRDWKTVERLTKTKYFGSLPKEDHVEQISLYGWMCAGNETYWDEKKGEWLVAKGRRKPDRWAVDKGECVYIDPTDQARYVFNLWTHDLVEQAIAARLPLVARMMDQGWGVHHWREEGGSGAAPVELTQDIACVLPEADQWKCRFCDVFESCTILARRQGEKPPLQHLYDQATKPVEVAA